MKILVINPNTNRQMTQGIAAALEGFQKPELQIDVVGNTMGPASVEGCTDEIVSTMGILELVQEKQAGYDGFLISCYSNHPAVSCCRELVSQPVLGILEASIGMAVMLGHKFSIVTTSRRWVPLLEEGVALLGVTQRLASVRSTGLSVLDVAGMREQELMDRLKKESEKAVENDGAEVICLGCAGLVGLWERLSSRLMVPVIDGVGAGVRMLEAMVSLSLSTSKYCKYQFVEPRETNGLQGAIKNIYQP